MDFRSRQMRSDDSASINSDKQEVLAQSLQQDVTLLECDPFYAGFQFVLFQQESLPSTSIKDRPYSTSL